MPTDAFPAETPASIEATHIRWSWPRRIGYIALNAAIVWHLIALVIPPMSVSAASPITQAGWQLWEPYIQALYLNHGYQFFAPEPGPSTLLEYELTFADGRTETGRLPNRSIQPRLLYHRHFMLTEHLASIDDMTPETRASVLKAYGNQLLTEFGAESVRMDRITHLLPRRERVLAGGTLDDPASYRRDHLSVVTRSDAAAQSTSAISTSTEGATK